LHILYEVFTLNSFLRILLNLYYTEDYFTNLFTLKDYSEFVNIFKLEGYSFKFFLEDSVKKEKCVYLRHDIDFSLEHALEMALVEKDLDIKSTYFIMLSSNSYNPFSEVNRKIIKNILSLGHQISLHFDPNAHEKVNESFNDEVRFFQTIFQKKINIVSLHRPGQFLNSANKNYDLNGFPHTYQSQFFEEMEYFSDSRGSDLHHILNKSKLKKLEKSIHLLIHPIWWTKKAKNPKERLICWLNANYSFLLSETQKNCRVF